MGKPRLSAADRVWLVEQGLLGDGLVREEDLDAADAEAAEAAEAARSADDEEGSG